MELKLVASVELARHQQVGKSNFSTVHCSAFHPSEPHLFVAVEDEIYMTDAMQGQVMARFSINAGQIVALFPARTEPLLGAVVALGDEFLLYIWNLHQMVIKAVHSLKHISTKKPASWGLHEVKLYYAQQSSKSIYVLDWKDGSTKKLESPKPVQHMYMHPTKPQLACLLGDGSIRLINVITSNSTTWNDGSSAVQDKIVNMTFHPTQPYMIALTANGNLMCWNTNSKEYFGSVKGVNSEKETIEHVHFHSTLPFVLTVNNNGAITAWNFFARNKTWIIRIMNTIGHWELSPAIVELSHRYGHLPNFSSKFASEPVLLSEFTAHTAYNFFSFNFRFVAKSASELFMHQHLLDSVRIGIYGVHLFEERACNMVIPQQHTMMFWASPEKDIRIKSRTIPSNDKFPPPKLDSSSNLGLTPRAPPEKETETTKETTNVFYFSNETFLLDDLNLLAYSPAYNDISVAKRLPQTDFEGLLLRPTRLVRSYTTDRFLVFFLRQDAVKDLTTFGVAVVCRDTVSKDITISPAAGQRGIFFGSDEEFLVLSENGCQVEIWKNEEDTTLPMVYDLPSPMAEVFWTPLEGGNIIWFADLQRCRLIASFKNHISGSKFMLNSQCCLRLHPGEEVIQVAWHRVDETPLMAAIVTSRRVLIVNEKLQILSAAQEVASSCLWLGAAVVFNTKSHLQYLTLRNSVKPLISLRLPDAVLLGLLNDRVALAVRRSGETSVVTNAIGLLEPLVIGFLHYFEAEIEELDRKKRTQILLDCAESYDARRISWQLIEEVTKQGYREFALQILLANPHLLTGHHQFAFELALTTYHYTTAFALIERSSVLKTAPNLFRLQRAALRLGQFDVARKCAECNSDWTTLLYLYTLSKNKDGLLILKKTLERDRDINAGLISLIEKQLQLPEIASLPTKIDVSTMNTSALKPLATSEAQKLLARQDSRLHAKMSAKHFQYTPQPILTNMARVTNQRWKVENHARIPCEMRTLPLESGSGNLVIGPLLLNTLLGDWFTRQVPSFELPEVLQGDKRDVILKLLAQRQADPKKRTMTIGGGPQQTPVPTLSLSGLTSRDPPGGKIATSRPVTSAAHPASTPLSSLAVPQQPNTASTTSGTSLSPRKLASSTTLRPLSTVAANLMNAIANSGTKSTEGSPVSGLAEDSASLTDSETLGKTGDATATAHILTLAEQALTNNPLMLFMGALAKLETADIDGCVLDLNSVLISLLASNAQNSTTVPPADSFLRKQVLICVHYKRACYLLHQIRKLDEAGTKRTEVAWLAQFLADIPVLPRHRLVLLRLATKKNLVAKNFNFASKCLQMLAKKSLPDSATLESLLEECKTNNFRESEALPDGTKLCLKSFASRWILPKHSCIACTLCQASYHTNLISLAAYCPCCFWRNTLVLVPPVTAAGPSKSSALSDAALGTMIPKDLSL